MAERATAKVIRHAHGCSNGKCLTYYEDACEDKGTNGLCSKCRMGHCWELLVENRRPKDCCLYDSKKATKEEIKLYRLSGNATWWHCSFCARSQIFEPGSLADPRRLEKK